MATTTLGVKVDDTIRQRLRNAASQLGCTAHWLHKQALITYIDAIERGQLPEEISFLVHGEGNNSKGDINTSSDNTLPPFFHLAQDVQPQSVLRANITSAYRRPEPECLPLLLDQARVVNNYEEDITKLATKLITELRKKKSKGSGVESLVHEFSLSSQEGVALMCMAEALLRIPDKATRDALIRDKISHGDWRSHVRESSSLFVNAATWGLMLTGKLVSVNSEQNLSKALTRVIAKGGEPLIRGGVNAAMRLMGEQFVTGQTISAALANSRKWEEKGFRYSYDMLGEAAITAADAQRYFNSYEQAIHAIGKASNGKGIYEGNGISIKLSALHPRYSRAQRDRVMSELYPRLKSLVCLAMSYDIGVNIDAEEADRLDLSLDLLESICFSPELAGWNGIGFVVQAYQKRALFVVDYLIDLAKRSKRRIMVRLVKGAYWDTEIKRAQLDGLEGYPVFTRKIYTDVSYLACARRLLEAPDAIYPQFATHNAQTLAAIYYMAGRNYYAGQYEFQCLHGMGESLYEQVTGPVSDGKLNRPCRIYAPVGTHDTLLAYLVRRLLENGANTSFVNQVMDDNINISDLVVNPVRRVMDIVPQGRPHNKIPLPISIYGESRLNSSGLDLSNEQRLASLSATLSSSSNKVIQAMPTHVLEKNEWNDEKAQVVRNPANYRDIVGRCLNASSSDINIAFERAANVQPIWQSTAVEDRAECLIVAARIMEERMQDLIGVVVREAGKSIPNAIAEVREAVDFLRYYAREIINNFNNDSHRPLGTVVCISPWNFPLAIFTGQVSAALAAGNVVLAKPAEQTNLIAAVAVSILHEAGVPMSALQLVPGPGDTVGAELVNHPQVSAVMFTGSTATANTISRALSGRLDVNGHTIPFIAETGGLNAMIVDSSALAEQVVSDIIMSAFDSAGQRCSALRLLCVQDDCADYLLEMLHGAMQELRVGDPSMLSTDVGPVIDNVAKSGINEYIFHMSDQGFKVSQISIDHIEIKGTYVAPTIIEVNSPSDVTREVFGPVLHVMRYNRKDLDTLVEEINMSGYGLTFGVHTRIDETVDRVVKHIRAGNIYVNRNIVGAVVGVQPFGGERLSGTGPKAGGPLYLLRLLARAPEGLPVWCKPNLEVELPGPTGERNSYHLSAKGLILCIPATTKGLEVQIKACVDTGNKIAVLINPGSDIPIDHTDLNSINAQMVSEDFIESGDYSAVLFEGDSDTLSELSKRVANREGPIISVQGLASDEIQSGGTYRLTQLLREVSISVNTAAAGGNASLMMIG